MNRISGKLQMNIIGDYHRNKRKLITKLAKKFKLNENTIRNEINKDESRKVWMRK